MALCNSKNKVKGIPQGSANSAVLANVYMLKYYLGFSFDGTKVKIRDKTMTKYYYRMHRKVNTVGRWLYKHKRMETNSLYRLYSDSRSKKEKKQENIDRKCKFRKYEGNFITYCS
ncbi:MAG: hypothetical protein II089_02315 [Selenomonas sp.]|nr:hypothetical protein [Selenomonas sp.]